MTHQIQDVDGFSGLEVHQGGDMMLSINLKDAYFQKPIR